MDQRLIVVRIRGIYGLLFIYVLIMVMFSDFIIFV